jgi:hypothetical protein
MTDSAASLAVQLAGLRKQFDELQAVVQKLNTQDYPLLAQEVEALTQILQGHIEAHEERAAGRAAPRWDDLDRDEHAAQLEQVRTFVDGLLLVAYGEYWRDVLRDCWPYHPAALWEIGNLWAEWHRVYDQKPPSLTGALNWHDRWMPAAKERLRPIMKGCGADQCVARIRVQQ